MTPKQKRVRLEWPMENMKYRQHEWRSISFSDEEIFNLHDPAGWAYYRSDLRKYDKVFLKRQVGGGSLLIWACFSYFGKCGLVFLKGRVDERVH